VANEFRAWDGAAWSAFSGLPSQVSQSGKFLTTNGSTASWASVPDPQPATPTDDGLVFGFTPSSEPIILGGWNKDWGSDDIWIRSTGTQSLEINYFEGIAEGWNIWIAANVKIGDPVYITRSGVRSYYGVVESLYPATGISGDTQTTIRVTNPNNLGTWRESGIVMDSPLTLSGGNVSLGYNSSDEGAQNTVIGYGAGSSITTGSNLTVVGYDAEPSSATATNEATFGNSDTTKTRIFGALAINDQTGTTGQVLTSNGSSAPTWQTSPSAPVTSVNTKTGAVVLTASDVGAAADADVVKLTGDQTVAGTKTFSSTISGNISGNAGTVTNGVVTTGSYADPTWITSLAETKVLPSQTSQAGKYLTTNGTSTSWAAVDALPDQTGNAGEYLTTNGTTASWTPLNTDANTTTKGLYENNSVISANYTITTGNNAMSAGPITVNAGVTVTVPSGSRWTIV
jgi:hypothetical protein